MHPFSGIFLTSSPIKEESGMVCQERPVRNTIQAGLQYFNNATKRGMIL